MRRRLVLVAAGLAAALLAPIALWGVVVRSTVVDDIGRRESDQRLLVAQLAGASIERTLDEAARRLDLLARRPQTHASLSARDQAALEGQLADLARDTIYATALALDPAGKLLARYPAAPETYGQSFADRDYYRGAVAGDGVFISEAVVSRITGQTVVVLALAVREQQRPLGLLLLTLGPAELLALLQPLRATSGRDLHLLDQHSRVIASTDLRRAPLSELRVPGVERLDGETRSIAARVDGVEKVLTYAPIAAAGWALVVTDDPSVILAAQRTFEQQLVAGGAATVVLSLAAAVGIAWLFTTTLRQRTLLAEREHALARANADLEDASRHKSEFLASMSHELRTPLNAVLGFSDLLLEQLAATLTPAQRRYFTNIKDAGSHLLELINEVLDLAKVEAGRIDLRPEEIRTKTLLEPVIAAASERAAAAGLEFTPTFPAEASVRVDPGRVRQILYNLLSNAVKFTPAGRVELDVEIRGRDLAFEVRDTGMGIPTDKMDRVFGTFERLHEGRSEIGGTGLGLALTRRLVELHGGTIAFDSVEGRGSTFRVFLPEVVASPVRGPRVLVVEDDRRDAELLAALAGRVGIACEVVGTAQAARDAIRRDAPTAVILDLRLPDERGDVLLEELKGAPATRAIPVLVVSVEDDDGRARILGAEDHLTKPIDGERVAAWMRRMVSRRTQGVAAAS